MQEICLKGTVREIFRWYLSKFPLRDGKAYFYQQLHRLLAPEDRFATVKLDKGFFMKLDLKDPEQLKVYFFGHYHERYEALLVERLLDPGEFFLDIGANVGYFCLVAARALNNTGLVIGMEPAGNAYARLMDNLALNPFTNIRILKLAVADKLGEAVLYLLDDDIADTSANIYQARQDQGRREAIPTMPLDTFLDQYRLRPPHLIKMDVEGAELAVLHGASHLLAQAPPLLLVEMEEKNLLAAGAGRRHIQDLLQSHGYRSAYLTKGRWRLVDDLSSGQGRNIFWFKPSLPMHRAKARSLPVLGEF